MGGEGAHAKAQSRKVWYGSLSFRYRLLTGLRKNLSAT